MVRKHHRQVRQLADVVERFEPLGFGPARGIGRPHLIGVEAAFDLEERLRFIGIARDDQRVMVHSRQVQLHAVKLDDCGNELARRLELRVSPRQVQLRVVGAAVIRGDHPRQPVPLRHSRIERRWVPGVAALNRRRRTDFAIVAGTPVRMDVRVTRQPFGGRRLQRAGSANRTGHEEQRKSPAHLGQASRRQAPHRKPPVYQQCDDATRSVTR